MRWEGDSIHLCIRRDWLGKSTLLIKYKSIIGDHHPDLHSTPTWQFAVTLPLSKMKFNFLFRFRMMLRLKMLPSHRKMALIMFRARKLLVNWHVYH